MRVLSFLGVLCSLALTPAFGSELVVYPDYPQGIERDEFYSVSIIQGDVRKPLTVWNHCEKSVLKDRTYGGDVNRRFCEFAFSGDPVRVDIVVTCDVSQYKVFPAAKRLRHSFRDGVISVYLDKPEYFGVQLNDYDKTILSVFADEPEKDVPVKGSPGVLYVDGWMDAPGKDGLVRCGSETKEIYIAPGAVLNARLSCKTPVKLHGRGMILDPMSDILRFDQTQNRMKCVVWLEGGKSVVDGVKIVDARSFNFSTWTDTVFRNVKVMASMMCSDGFLLGGRGGKIEHAWIYVGDNALVISGVVGAHYRDITIGTSCKAVFPQSSNSRVLLEDINIFRADEGILANEFNPAKQHLKEDFVIRRLSAVDSSLSVWLFRGLDTGTEEKRFVFDDVSIPASAGYPTWWDKGRKDGVVIDVRNIPGKLMATSNYVLRISNLCYDGKPVESFPEKIVTGRPGEVKVEFVPSDRPPTMPRKPDVRVVNWTRNLLAEVHPRHSIWQRHPSWMSQLEATGRDENGNVVYRLADVQRGAGMQAVVTEGFKDVGNGDWKFEFDARCASDVLLTAVIQSNRQRFVQKSVRIVGGGDWHRIEVVFATTFDMKDTELVSLALSVEHPVKELFVRRTSLTRVRR